MYELLEQLLKLDAPAAGHPVAVIEHQLNLALTVFDQAKAADFRLAHFVLRLIPPLLPKAPANL
jgi:hypothetical protein